MSEIRNNGSNNNTPNTLDEIATKQAKNIYVPDYIDTIFQRLDAQDVEYFYKSYHFWLLQQRLKTLHTAIGVVQQARNDNDTLMHQIQPSAIALASLAQLQASGVNDLDLLDRMLERGETWLDHTMQLLEQCEGLDVIGGDYTQWCEHALEGAYDWVESINATSAQGNETETQLDELTTSYEQQTDLQAATEEQLLQKLMSDGEITVKTPVPSHLFRETEQIEASVLTRKITQPLQQPEQEAAESSLPTRKITQPLQQPEQEATESSLPTRKITQPLLEIEALAEAEVPETPPTDEIEDEGLLLLQEPISQEITSPTNEIEDVGLLLLQESVPQEITSPENGPLQKTTSPESESLPEEQPHVSSEALTPDSGPLQEGQSYVANDTSISEISIPEEETEESITQKMVASHTGTVTTSKDIDVQEVGNEVEEVTVSDEDLDQTQAESVRSIGSLQESKNPQIQKVRRNGFWRLLSRLVAFILGR